MGTITFFGNTDMGQIRTNNEDAFIAQYIWDEKHILAVAIDGVGGYEGGEVASALAQKCIVEYLESYSDGERLDLLKQAVIHANNTIFSERKNLPQYSSMSCVLTAILVETESKRINMAHIGDTRLYQYANGNIVKLSHDHSLIGYREEIGELTEEQAMKHPQRNIIGRDVGSQFLESDGKDYVEVETFPLIPNSILLLCSDGLCDMVTSKQMKIELEKDLPVKDKVNNLIKVANEAGGKDNVTVVLVESTDPDCPIANDKIDDKTEPILLKEHHVIESSNSIEVYHVESKKNVSTPLKTFIIPISIAFVFIGYFLGGFTGNKVLPTIFHNSIQIDSAMVLKQDSIINELKNDTTELNQKIRKFQDYNKYLEIAHKQLKEGNIENAQNAYDVYLIMTSNKDAQIEDSLKNKP